jgi:exodeoxyribonuclease VII large subunit
MDTDRFMPDPPDAPARDAHAPMTVSELTRTIRRVLETGVGDVEVEGEVSNWMQAASGHAYFALKDEGALLSCVMFQTQRRRLKFQPADGSRVVARGAISVYEKRGQYQLIVSAMRESGLGELYRRFLELKEKLDKEGLFDPARKRPIPTLPRRIGIVTSPTGAALRDMINVITRRFPGVTLLVSPTLVQGNEAPPQIVRALRRFDALAARPDLGGPVDVIVVARGGGSTEDLWAFNDERVARAIAAASVPVISGVGHETDFTIADFVADLRAPTPSAAAEIVVREAAVLSEQVDRLRARMARALGQQVTTQRLRLQRLAGSWGLRQPLELVRQAIQRLDDLEERGRAAVVHTFDESRHQVALLGGRLGALNPTAVLERGYSIVSRARDGRVLTSDRQVRIADHVRIQLAQGELRATVIPRGEDLFDGTAL